jgi:hypothetical protein
MRILFFILVLLFASAPFFMAQASENLKCHGTAAVIEDQMPYKTDDPTQSMVYERNGNSMSVSVAGKSAEYKNDENFAVEDSETFAAVRERATGNIVLAVEKIPLMRVQKRWGAKAKYIVRGVDPRNGQALAQPVEVVCEKKI